MTLQQLRYAVKIAETKSFSEASEELFLSQPSLSNAIKDLEREIGIHIFNRSNKGVFLTAEGEEFLVYARQVLLQAQLLEEKYMHGETVKQRFSISTQHYAFATNAFVDVIKHLNTNKYELAIRESTTLEIIEDVSTRRSELGMIYLSSENADVINKLLKVHKLVFQEILKTTPHVCLSINHPLAKRAKLDLSELSEYPYLSFEQKKENSFYFSEELFSSRNVDKSIKVSDRGALTNLMAALPCYTITTGIVPKELHGYNLRSIPLVSKEIICVGIIYHKNTTLSETADFFLEALKQYIA